MQHSVRMAIINKKEEVGNFAIATDTLHYIMIDSYIPLCYKLLPTVTKPLTPLAKGSGNETSISMGKMAVTHRREKSTL